MRGEINRYNYAISAEAYGNQIKKKEKGREAKEKKGRDEVTRK